VNDEARALELLDPVAKNAASPLQGLAFLLGSYVFEQRRLGAQVQTLQQNVQGLQGNVQALQGNVQALQQKLDALKTLERSLSERREGGMTPRR
jgi:Skp family chaperone for outer membrane proteins